MNRWDSRDEPGPLAQVISKPYDPNSVEYEASNAENANPQTAEVKIEVIPHPPSPTPYSSICSFLVYHLLMGVWKYEHVRWTPCRFPPQGVTSGAEGGEAVITWTTTSGAAPTSPPEVVLCFAAYDNRT
jgi:hypothetical protein